MAGQTNGWRRSSRSSSHNHELCVEVRRFGDAVQLRDSKDPDGPVISVRPAQFDAFLRSISR